MKWNKAALLQSEYVKDEGNPLWWRWLVYLVVFVITISLGIVVAYLCLSKTVSPYEFAVRELKVPFMERSAKVMNVGRHLSIPYLMPIRKVKTELQSATLALPLHLSQDKNGEMTIQFSYRFFSEADNPAQFLKLSDEVGLRQSKWHSFVKAIVQEAVSTELGKLQKRLYASKENLKASDFGTLIDDASSGAAKKLSLYGIKLDSVLLSALPEETLNIKRYGGASKIAALNEEKGKLEDELTTFNASNELNLEKVRTDIEAKKAAVLADAKSYQEKKAAEADLIMTKALVTLEREKAAILAKAPDAEKYLNEKFKAAKEEGDK